MAESPAAASGAAINEPPEKIKAFRAYLEEQGVSAFLVEAIGDLYMAQPRPTSALQFLHERLAVALERRQAEIESNDSASTSKSPPFKGEAGAADGSAKAEKHEAPE